MNEKDFGEIGRRLRNVETDPPGNGWKKIASELSSDADGAPPAWWRRNGWKPLILLIPAVVISVYVGQRISTTSQNSTAVAIETEMTRRKDRVENSSGRESDQTVPEDSGAESPVPGTAKPNEPGVSSREPDHAAVPSLSSNEENNSISIGNMESVPGPDLVGAGDSSYNGNNSPLVTHDGSDGKEWNAGEGQPTPMPNELTASGERADSIATKNLSTFADEKVREAKLAEDLENVSPVGKHRIWRLSASYEAMFLNSSIVPVPGDDIFVTDVVSDGLKQVGFGVELGGGRMVTRDLLVDARLSYVEITQTTNYEYSTGDVDTLIATQLSDQRVIVSPVYNVEAAEAITKYSYGGLKIGATYFFWENPKRRFSLTASFGAYYRFSYDVSRKTNNRWESIPTDSDGGTMNYTFGFGAGYNRNLGHGWELTVGPNVTHWLRSSGGGSLPYNQTQSSLGLNFLLSKVLIEKR